MKKDSSWKWEIPKSSYLKDVVEEIDFSKVDFSKGFNWCGDGLDPGKDPEMKKLIENGTIFKGGYGLYYVRKPFEHKIFFMCPFTGMVCIQTETIHVEWENWEENVDK